MIPDVWPTKSSVPSSRYSPRRREAISAGAVADDHAVDGAVVLDLGHGVACAGFVRKVNPLCDHPIETDHLEALEPLLRKLRILRDRRKREPLRETLELFAALGERARVDRLAVPEEDVEHDVAGGSFR